tara:strand:- start:377 stop:595 length:219 start_codon:yes stop_codon:yes gene_type:complete
MAVAKALNAIFCINQTTRARWNNFREEVTLRLDFHRTEVQSLGLKTLPSASTYSVDAPPLASFCLNYYRKII